MNLSGTVHLPVVGDVPKKVVAGGGVVLVGYVGYRYVRVRRADAAAAAAAAPADTPDYADASAPLPPSTATGGTGIAGGETETTLPGVTTDADWTNAAVDQLEVNGYDRTTVTNALADYLSRRPLSSAEQQIVQAAIAVEGYPPSGTYVIIPGGNTPVTVAPTITGISTTSTTAVISFNKAGGATYYRAYRSGASSNVGSADGSPITVSGLDPNTEYSFEVAGDTTSNTPGPKSSPVKARTKPVTLARPSTPHITSVTRSSAIVSTGHVPNADYYRWYVNGGAHGSSDAPTYTLTGLKKSTHYTVTVAADTTSGAPGPQSAGASFTTKRS